MVALARAGKFTPEIERSECAFQTEDPTGFHCCSCTWQGDAQFPSESRHEGPPALSSLHFWSSFPSLLHRSCFRDERSDSTGQFSTLTTLQAPVDCPPLFLQSVCVRFTIGASQGWSCGTGPCERLLRVRRFAPKAQFPASRRPRRHGILLHERHVQSLNPRCSSTPEIK